MSDDPLIERLSQLTPDGAGLDRDALLFAAGRASARPSRVWPMLAMVLALTQAVTLGLLFWPRDVAPMPMPVKTSEPVIATEPPPAPDANAAWVLTERYVETGSLPPLPALEPLVPPEETLRAFGPLPADLLQ